MKASSDLRSDLDVALTAALEQPDGSGQILSCFALEIEQFRLRNEAIFARAIQRGAVTAEVDRFGSVVFVAHVRESV